MPLSTTLSRAARSGLKPTPSSMKVDMRPLHQMLPAVDAVDPGEALQQRALARAVAPDDPEELSRAHVEGDVLERPEGLVARAAHGVQRALLERVGALLGHAEGLADRLCDDWRRGAAGELGHPGEGYRGGWGTIAACRSGGCAARCAKKLDLQWILVKFIC